MAKDLSAPGPRTYNACYMTKKDHYLGILLEDIQHRLKLVQESLTDLPAMREDIRQIKADQAEMRQWRNVFDLVVRDHDKTLNDHETRLGKLETA